MSAGPGVEAFEQPPMLIDLAPTIVQIPGKGGGDEPSAVSDTEGDEMGEHLRGLGYIEWSAGGG